MNKIIIGMRSTNVSDTVELSCPPPGPCANCAIGGFSLYAPTLKENPEAISRLRKETRQFAAERTIIRENTIPTEFYTIYSGWGYIFKLLPDGRRQIIVFLLPGDTFSLWSIASPDVPLHYTFRSLTPMTLCVFDRQEILRQAVAASPAQIAAFQGTMERAHGFLTRRIVDLGRRSAKGRICQLILELEGRLRKKGLSDGSRFTLPATQAHIADTLGLTSVYVSRTLAELRRDNIFELQDSVATILDAAALRTIADE